MLEEISLVDRPANPGARVVFFKRDDSPMPKPADKVNKLAITLATALAKAGVDDVTAEGLAAELTEALAPGEDDTPKVEEPEVGKADKTPADETDDGEPADGKKVPPWMKDKLKKLEDERDALAKRVETLEGDVKKAAGLEKRLLEAEGTIAGFKKREQIAKLEAELADEGVANPAEAAELLHTMAEEPAKKLRERLISDARVMKTQALALPAGSGRTETPPNSAEAEIDRRATKRAADDKIPYANAYTKILEEDEPLRKRLDSERIMKRRAA